MYNAITLLLMIGASSLLLVVGGVYAGAWTGKYLLWVSERMRRDGRGYKKHKKNETEMAGSYEQLPSHLIAERIPKISEAPANTLIPIKRYSCVIHNGYVYVLISDAMNKNYPDCLISKNDNKWYLTSTADVIKKITVYKDGFPTVAGNFIKIKKITVVSKKDFKDTLKNVASYNKMGQLLL